MSSTEQTLERRQHRRLHVAGAVIFKYAGMHQKARIENVSLGGLYTTLHRPLQPGAELALDIPLPSGDVVVVRAEVIRSYSGGAALRFHWLGEDDRSRLLLQGVLNS